MSAHGRIQENHDSIPFARSECSDGMCCFTCVIPPGNKHIGFFKSLWKRGTGYPYVKLLVTSEGYKDEWYDSCKFLNFTIAPDAARCHLIMDLRCSIYKSRPTQCVGYPDRAGESLYQSISGPCIFNEYTAPPAYRKLVYKREWKAFYAISDQADAIRGICVHEDSSAARSLILEAKGVVRTTLLVGNREREYILIPIQKQTENILYISEKHQPIATIRQAYSRWEEKIHNNLINHYGEEWESRLQGAIEMEEKDACKRGDEDTTGNPE
ncbi:MAG: hypothetical protein B6D35_06260 [Candidatus Brocadia sp. UTAMX2]|jgi:Fe-S-cluster containining protein|nr:MAG: hypothetical protein B6D35_06260 [Candidatus Brocadia sp. UTAMX2]